MFFFALLDGGEIGVIGLVLLFLWGLYVLWGKFILNMYEIREVGLKILVF